MYHRRYKETEIFYFALITFASSILGTITGFGISTLMVPVVLLFLPLTETLLLVGIIHWFADLWRIFLFKKGLNWKIILFFGIPGIITAYLGARMVVSLPERFLSQLVGSILVAYVLFTLIKPNFKLKPSALSAVLGGAGSGFMGGLTGVGGGALRAIVLTSFGLSKSVYLFTSGVLGATIDASRITTYFGEGIRLRSGLLGMILFVAVSFLGAKIGQKLVNKIPQKLFKSIIGIFLFLLGLKFVLFP